MRHAALNRVYRLVWSHVHHTWVIVSERTRGRGKGTGRKLAAVAALAAAGHAALAAPVGGVVTAGSAGIAQSGSVTTVTQASQSVSVNWQSFNTTSQETVNFAQPSTSAIAVNRIADTNPTQFFGHLNANGQVYLVNPNGILFGGGSQINVGGLVASTLNISDADVASGVRRFSGDGTGSIVNQGAINAAPGGYVAFLGNSVSNQGAISAPGGAVALGAGSDVTLSFAGNSLVNLQVNQSTLNSLAENGSLIRADGGAVWMTAGARDAVLASVVNNTGIIQARSVQNVNGTIVLEGGAQSTVTNSGMLDASGTNAGEKGGTVKVLGQNVNLAATSKIDVSGDVGGGTALVGGNFTGAGPEQNALATTVAAGSSIKADAITSGNGGSVAVWSNDTTDFSGTISARGGAASGDGGSVETSGKHLKIGASAAVITSAPHGRTGDWLLDPQNFTIGGFNPGDGDITGDQITSALQSSNVTIKTGQSVSCTGTACAGGQSGFGDIIIADGALIGGPNWTSNTTLTLSAYRNVNVGGSGSSIDASYGTGNLIFRADNAATGNGTVLFGNQANVYGNTFGTIKIYYNPTSYSTPTQYQTMQDGYGNPTISFYDANDGLISGSQNLHSYMLVNMTASIANRTYDGTAAATFTGLSVLRAAPAGVTIDTSSATAAFVNKNAGVNKSVTIQGVTLSNTTNYALNGLDTLTATINRANLAVSGVTANSKTYNATNAATLSGTATVSGFAGDAISVHGSGIGAFSDKNVGTGKAVSVTGYSLTGADAANYNIVQPTGLLADITKVNVSVSGVSAATKTYDGTSVASLNGTATVSAYGSDVVTVSGAGIANFSDKNAGSNKVVTVTGYTLSGTDAVNYNIVQPTGLTATINKAYLEVSGLSVANKVYDGITTATLNGTPSVSPLGGDVISVIGAGTATFANKNAGTDKAVAVSGFSLTGADAGNYLLGQPSGLTANIDKANLTLSGVTANSKTYDGTTAAMLSGVASITAIGADVVSVTGSGTGSAFDTKNAGTAKAVSVAGYTLTGVDAANYNLVMPSYLTGDVAKANLAVAGVSAANKTYDGTTSAMLNGTATVTTFGSDVVSVTGTGIAAFTDKNAGSNKAVTVTGYSLSGTDGGNYNPVQPTGLTATIDKAALAVSGISAANKTYDGTTAVMLTGTGTVTAFGSDVVSVIGTGAGVFSDKNVGVGKAISATGFSLAGADAANYNIVQPTGLAATINKADLAIAGLSAADKVYDGTAAATLSGVASVTAFGGDVVSLSGTGAASFADKNVGSNKGLAVTGFTLSGADSSNYRLVSPGSLTASITPAAISVSGITASDKMFDGSTAATVNTAGAQLAGLIGSDAVTLTSTGAFIDALAGNGKTVALSNHLSGVDAGNYVLGGQTTTRASITPAPVVTTPTAPTPSEPPVANVPAVQAVPSTPSAQPAASSPAIPSFASSQQAQNIVTQVQSSILPPQAAAQPQSLNLSSTIMVRQETTGEQQEVNPARANGNTGSQLINTAIGFGTSAPTLQIQNGGMHLPPMATTISN